MNQAWRPASGRDRVPLELGARTNLIGTPDMIGDRLRRYRDAGVTTLQAKLSGSPSQRLDTLAQLAELTEGVRHG